MTRIFTVAAALVLAGTTACSSTGVQQSGSRRGDGATTSTTRPAATVPTSAPAATPPPGPLRTLTSRLDLPVRQLPAGGRVQGTLVVENGTDAPVELSRGCEPKWSVVLTDAQAATPDVVFTLACRSSPPVILAPGTNRLPFTLSGVVWSCRPPTLTIVPPPTTCPADVVATPAPGRYFAVLVGLPAVPRPARVDVRLTG